MRERANQIEELQQQLKMYQDVHPLNAQTKDGTCQQTTNCINGQPIPPPNKQREAENWSLNPHQSSQAATLGDDPYHTLCLKDHHQADNLHHQQVCQAPMEQQLSTRSPTSSEKQKGMKIWASPTTDEEIIISEPPTPAPYLPIKSGMNSNNSTLTLGSEDLSTPTYEAFSFEMADLVSERQQSTSLLHMAVLGNHVDTIRVLLQDDRVRVDDRDSDGFTPLQMAVMHGRSKIVKLLLEYSADTGPVTGFNLPVGTAGGFGTNLSRE